MKRFSAFELTSGIADDLLNASETYRESKKGNVRRFFTIVAAAVLILTLTVAAFLIARNIGQTESTDYQRPPETPGSETADPTQSNPVPGIPGDAPWNPSDFQIENGVLTSYRGSAEVLYLPDGINTLSATAFSENQSVRELYLPSTVTKIENGCLQNCERLEDVHVSKENESFSRTDLFLIHELDNGKEIYYCKRNPDLSRLVIPEGITAIKSRVFFGWETVTEVILPDSLISIDDYAFAEMRSLRKVSLGGTKEIGDHSFFHNTSLLHVDFGERLEKIGDFSFMGCWRLADVSFGNNVTSIGYSAFNSCQSLLKMTLPASIATIQDKAFEGCSSLYQVTNLSKLELHLESSKNGYITAHAAILIDQNGNKIMNSELYTETDDAFLFKRWNNTYRLIAYLGDAETVTLPEKMNGNSYIISNMRGVRNVVIPNSFTSVNDWAFADCVTLTNVILPESITSIGYSAFRCCELTDIVIPNSVKSICAFAFSNCEALSSITIPNSVTSIGDSAFIGCSCVKEMVVESGNPIYRSTGNCLIEIETKTLLYGCENSLIPSDGSIKAIRAGAFTRCIGLLSITIPNDVTEIEIGTFNGCIGLQSVTIPATVKSIGGHAFDGCIRLKEITFHGTVEKWKQIEKEPGWNADTGAYIVHCTDGDIEKS